MSKKRSVLRMPHGGTKLFRSGLDKKIISYKFLKIRNLGVFSCIISERDRYESQ